jgi:glyoxylase-like metal-dependent hydrolase (beta-lactamase superfamily II)
VHDLWTTPHGVLKAAMANSPSATRVSMNGKDYTAVSFTVPNAFKATAYLNADHLVERIDSVQPHPVSGDTTISTTFGGYREHGGVKFPSRIQQSAGGYEVLDLHVNEVAVNGTAPLEVPGTVAAFVERATSEKVADGVWFIGGGSHNSVAIEMRDHLIVVESPLYDGRAQAMLAEVKKLSPKPIKYVINSHHHFDHAGGLRAAAAEGAEIIVAEEGRPYFERMFANGNTIAPDALQKSGRRASFSGYDGKRVLTDGSRTIELHSISGSVHARGFNLVYLPAEKIIIQADAYTPGAPNTPPPATPNANNLNLVQNVERLKLAVDRILPLHGRVVPYSELLAAVGRR